MFADMSAGAL